MTSSVSDSKGHFSVVMAVYSAVPPEHFLMAGRSVLLQTLSPAELVVVVDGEVSQAIDAVMSELQLLGEVRIFRLKENVGPGAARHIGILQARYDVVAVMDSDDISLPTRFEKQYNKLHEQGVGIVGAWIKEFTCDSHNSLTLRTVPETHSEIVRYAKSRSPMNNVTIMFKKESYLRAGGYSSMRSFEDYDLFVRMIQSGTRFYNVQEVLVDVRGGSQMFSRRGGLSQVGLESSMLLRFYKSGFYSLNEFLFNLCLRTTMRLLPNFIRKTIYMIFLRKDV